jgi:hypothetical protein
MCHCGKNHSTNYQSCEVIKGLKNLKDNKNKTKQEMKTNKVVREVPNNEPKNLKL